MPITDEEIVKAATSLGVLGGGSATAHRILAMLCDTSLGAREIAEHVQREPGIAVRVLKVANSAFYGHSRDIATLDRALLILGLDAVRGIAAAACLNRSIGRRTQIGAVDPNTLVNHCVASAFAAEQLARVCRRPLAGEAFMAALLHDFGVPVQERLDPDGVNALQNELGAHPEANVLALEQSLVRVTHGRCAQVIFNQWRLPESITLAAQYHDDPLAAPAAALELTALVYLGIQLAITADFTIPTELRPWPVPREPLLQMLGLDEASFEPILEQLPERVLLVAEAVG